MRGLLALIVGVIVDSACDSVRRDAARLSDIALPYATLEACTDFDMECIHRKALYESIMDAVSSARDVERIAGCSPDSGAPDPPVVSRRSALESLPTPLDTHKDDTNVTKTGSDHGVFYKMRDKIGHVKRPRLPPASPENDQVPKTLLLDEGDNGSG